MSEFIVLRFQGSALQVHSYSLFLSMAAAAAVLGGLSGIRILKLPFVRSLLCLLIMAFCVPVGARALNVALNYVYYTENTGRIWEFNASGFSLMGGLILASAAGFLLCSILKVSFPRLGDALAPALGAGIALTRIGCFLNGCCFGVPAHIPWAVEFPAGSPAYIYFLTRGGSGFDPAYLSGTPALHPVQLYEAAAALLAAVLAIILIRRHASAGIPGTAAAMLFTLARLGNHFLRARTASEEVSVWFYPALYAAVLGAEAFLLWRYATNRLRKSKAA